MGIIPRCISDKQLMDMPDADFDRLVVSPGERLCAEILRQNAAWKAENQAFLDERYQGITIEEARLRWVTDEEQGAIQREYREWQRGRAEPELAIAA